MAVPSAEPIVARSAPKPQVHGGICGARRAPMGAIRFEPCPESPDHPAGLHYFEAVGPDGSGES